MESHRSPTPLDRVREALAAYEPVEKRMMGSIVFMIGGHMCCSVKGSALMVRVGPDAYRAALDQPGVGPLTFGGKAPLGYVMVDASLWRTRRDLDRWLGKALAFVATLGERPAGKRKRR